MVESTSHNLMIRIDGDKIRTLREQKGLTQLYIATAVQVTTDTISRWENKRYPTIKRENAIRLAEALEVDLDEVIDTSTSSEQTSHAPEVSGQEHPPEQKATKARTPLLISALLGSCLVAALSGIMFYYFYDPDVPRLTAQRIMPSHCISGQPFPVAIEVDGAREKQVTLIVKEQPPETIKILGTYPEISPSGSNDGSLRWLDKIDKKALYVYIAKLTTEEDTKIQFKGNIAVSADNGKPISIIGSSTITSGKYHWADTDRDNIISDIEILKVYDRFGELPALSEDIDKIEEIWLGSGYRWNNRDKRYEILP